MKSFWNGSSYNYNRKRSTPSLGTADKVSEAIHSGILKKSIESANMIEMYDSSPELFDFNKLTSREKERLLLADYKKYSFLKKDMEKKSTYNYIKIWADNPTFMCMINFKKFRKNSYRYLAQVAPQYFKEHNLSTDLLEYEDIARLVDTDPETYKETIMEKVRTFRSPTNVRKILKASPLLMASMTTDDADKCVLTAKQLILLLNHEDVKEGAKYSDEVTAWLELQLSMEVLTGESKKTTQLSKARKVLKDA